MTTDKVKIKINEQSLRGIREIGNIDFNIPKSRPLGLIWEAKYEISYLKNKNDGKYIIVNFIGC